MFRNLVLSHHHLNAPQAVSAQATKSLMQKENVLSQWIASARTQWAVIKTQAQHGLKEIVRLVLASTMKLNVSKRHAKKLNVMKKVV
jgi:hypothetical protein